MSPPIASPTSHSLKRRLSGLIATAGVVAALAPVSVASAASGVGGGARGGPDVIVNMAQSIDEAAVLFLVLVAGLSIRVGLHRVHSHRTTR